MKSGSFQERTLIKLNLRYNVRRSIGIAHPEHFERLNAIKYYERNKKLARISPGELSIEDPLSLEKEFESESGQPAGLI